ncbi:MAG: hypothetical protein LBR10_12250 [Prevotellaceae bacterium]|nr:hypothetical protein [Prevotellaceae bacterium]
MIRNIARTDYKSAQAMLIDPLRLCGFVTRATALRHNNVAVEAGKQMF